MDIKKYTLVPMVGGLAFALSGCFLEDDTTITAQAELKPVISGKAILSDTGEGLANARVRLRIGGQWYETTTAGGDNHRTGDFTFRNNIPAYASFFIEIDPREDEYANSYTFGTTNATDSGAAANPDELLYDLSVDVGAVAVYDAAETSINLIDVDTGAPISGVGMWMEPAGFGGNSTGDGKAGAIAAPFIQPEETVDGTYTFTMPDNGVSVGVYVNGLVDANGVVYQTLAGDLLQPGNLDGECGMVAGPAGTTVIAPCENGGHDDNSFGDHSLTNIAPGVGSSIYLRQYTATDLTVNFELVDDNGQAFDAGAAIDVQETTSGQVFSAVQSADQSNVYSITIPYQRDLSFAIASMDSDGDGFKDTSTALVFNTVDRVPGQTAVTLGVTIDELTDYTPIQATVVSDTLIPGTLAEAVVVFNQPVVLTGTNAAQARFSTLNDSVAADNTDWIAPLATILDSAGNVGPALTLTQQAAPNANEWDYTDNTAAAATFTLPGADGDTGNIVYPYERRVDVDETIVAATATATNSSNTIYRVSIDPTTIGDLQSVGFSLTVRSELTGEVQRVVATANSDVTTNVFTGLADLVLDDGNYIDDTSRTVLTTNPSEHVNVNEDLSYAIANTSGLSTCSATAGADCRFLAAVEPGNLTVGVDNTLSLVSPVAFYGKVKLVSYVTETNTAGQAVQSTTAVYDDPIFVYHEASELNELVQQQAGGNTLCATADATCKEQGAYYYFLADPNNQALDDKAGGALNAAFGTNVANWARGYARGTGIGYMVPLTDLNINVAGGDLLKSATLDVDVMVNGVRYTDTLTLTVN